MKKSILVLSLSSILLLASCGESKVPTTFLVSFSSGEGYTINGEKETKEGDAYSFSVSFAEGYEAGSSYAVKANGEEVKRNGDVYTVPSVQEDLLITVEGVSKIVFSVDFAMADFVTFEGANSVTYGEDYSFSCKVEEGYSYTSISIKENGQNKTFEEKDGLFNVKNIKGNLVISAEGIARSAVKIKKDFATEHFVFQGDEAVTYGEDYSFTLSFAPGYKKGKDFLFLLNDEITEFQEGKTYTVKNVTCPVHIELSGEEVIVSSVEFVCDIPGAIKNKKDSLPYFVENFSFSLMMEDHYTDCENNLAVYSLVDEIKTPLTRAEDGTYSLPNPKKDFKILVEGASINMRTVSFYRDETKVYEVSVPMGTALPQEELDKAKVAFSASLEEGERFAEWDKVLTSIETNIDVHGISEKRITSEEELKAMKSDGRYYLASDIQIAKSMSAYCMNLGSFSGVLNGDGHRIYAKWGLRDSEMQGYRGVLFSRLTGTVKNLELEYTTSFSNQSISGIAGTMDGGLIENVTVRTHQGSFAYGTSAPLVSTINGGTIRNSDVYFVSETFDSTKEDYAPVAAIVGNFAGGMVENITVHLPAPVDASKLNLARYGGEKLVNCKVVKDERKLADSALKSPVATEETYLGMPVTKMEVSNGNGGTMFVDLTTKQEGVSSRSFFCRVENYVRDGVNNQSTMAISSDGTFCLPSMADRTFWTYIEVRHLDSGVYICVCPFVNKTNAYRPTDLSWMPATSAYFEKMEFGGLWTWSAESKATVYSTPIYCH